MKKLIFALLLVALCIGVPSALVAGPVDQVTTFVSDTAAPAVAHDVAMAVPAIEGIRLGVESAALAEAQAPPESVIGILLMLAIVGIAVFSARRIQYFTMGRVQKRPWRQLMNAASVNTVLRC